MRDGLACAIVHLPSASGSNIAGMGGLWAAIRQLVDVRRIDVSERGLCGFVRSNLLDDARQTKRPVDFVSRLPLSYVSMMEDEANLLSSRVASLSDRQREILRMVSRDVNSKEIARKLGLSDETVKNHIKAAMRRLGVSSRFDAARLLRMHEHDDPRVVMDPSRVISVLPSNGNQDVDDTSRVSTQLREHRAVFELDGNGFGTPAGTSWSASGERSGAHSALRMLTLIVVLTVAVAIAVISAAPLAKSVQELTNMIEPPTRHS